MVHHKRLPDENSGCSVGCGLFVEDVYGGYNWHVFFFCIRHFAKSNYRVCCWVFVCHLPSKKHVSFSIF